MKRYKKLESIFDKDPLEGKQVKTLIDKTVDISFKKGASPKFVIPKNTKGVVTFIDRTSHVLNVKFNIKELQGTSVQYGINNVKKV